MSWRPSPMPTEVMLAFERPVEVRVLTTQGPRVRIFAPIVRNDSIVPIAGPTPGVALAHVATVEVRQVSTGRSVMFGLTSITFVFFSWNLADRR